ncbi:MAG TPA: hypothetical protein VII98_09305 [Solirubrobacteraceae bacterium]
MTAGRLRLPYLLGFVVLTGAVVATTGCGGSNAGSGASLSTGTSTTPTTRSLTTGSTGIDPMPGAGTAPIVVHATNKRTALLTAVRAARHEGFDRVVFEFRDALPGYDVRYVPKPLRQDGSGRIVPVSGAYVARIRMENALDADLTKSTAPLTYRGRRRFSPPTPELVELVTTGGFEGILTWAAGLHDHVDFRVSTLRAPPRLVIDFRNH